VNVPEEDLAAAIGFTNEEQMHNKYAITAPTKKAPAANPFSKKRQAEEITPAPVKAPSPVKQ
jgi:hypothetical protein